MPDYNLKTIKSYDKNAKKHTTKQVKQIADSISNFGFHQPIVVDKQGVIIVGHGRYEACKLLGIEPEIKMVDLTEEQAKAYRLADNKLNESDWDMNLVIEELKGLSDEMFDLTGFDVDLLIEPDEKDDIIPENVPARSKLGDLYELGNHRVLCSDSTQQEVVLRLMGQNTAELLFTSPPYSDMRTYGGGKDLSVNNLVNFIGVFYPFCNYQAVNIGIQRKDNDIFQFWDEYISVAKSVGYKLLAWNVWKKNGVSIGQQSAFIPIYHEWIFVFGKEFKNINRSVLRKLKPRTDEASHRMLDGTMQKHNRGISDKFFKEMESVIEISSVGGHDYQQWQTKHPATFPVELPQEYIRAITNKEDIIVDPFLGSGSTLIACEKTGRICYGCELEPAYCDVIIQRYVDYVDNPVVKCNGVDVKWSKIVKTIK